MLCQDAAVLIQFRHVGLIYVMLTLPNNFTMNQLVLRFTGNQLAAGVCVCSTPEFVVTVRFMKLLISPAVGETAARPRSELRGGELRCRCLTLKGCCTCRCHIGVT